MIFLILIAVFATLIVASVCAALIGTISEGEEFQQGVALTIGFPLFFFIIFSAVWQWFGWIGGW